MTPLDIHNATASSIVKPTLEAGGDMTDVMLLLESVVVGVVLVAIRNGVDEMVLHQLLACAKARIAGQRPAPKKPTATPD